MPAAFVVFSGRHDSLDFNHFNMAGVLDQSDFGNIRDVMRLPSGLCFIVHFPNKSAQETMWLDTPPINYKVLDLPNGDKAYIHKSASIGRLMIGRYSYISENATLNGKYAIVIGAFSSIAANVYCWTYESHQTTYPTTFPLRVVLGMPVAYPDCVEKPEGVLIGSDVWIGEGARIMPGVKIANGCVIGARAVVTKDCEAYGVYVGAPAKQVKKRFPPNMIAQLLIIQWWNWPIEKIRRNIDFFSTDLNRFDGDLNQKIVD